MWRAVGSSAHQRLRLNQERAYTLDSGRDGDTTQTLVVLREQQLGGIAHLAQTGLDHLIDAQLGSTAKTVLDASQNTVHVALITFELDHRVDDMFQNLRAGNASLLGDMPNQKYRRPRLLGELE